MAAPIHLSSVSSKLTPILARAMDQQIRFCTTPDGVRIAWASIGEGPPLVKAANWLSHLEFDHKTPVWRHWLHDLSRNHRLIRYDERGCGLSDWDVEFSIEAWTEDLEQVVEATGVDRFALLGVSQGGSVAIEYAVRYPEKVTHLILYGAYATGWAHRPMTPEQTEEMEAVLTLTRQGWGRDNPAYRQIFSSSFIPEGTAEQIRSFNELQRVSTSADNAARFIRQFGEINVEHLLSRVTVPTLVLHARDDLRVPFEQGRVLASGIAGSRFVPLESRNHLILEHEPAWRRFVEEIEAFLGVEEEKVVASTGLPPDPSTQPLSGHTPVTPAHVAASPTAGVASVGADPHEVLATALAQRYRLEDEIGRGGMATVYRALDQKHDRVVAIKAIHPELIRGTGPQRFEREIKITGQLQHPHIVPLIDSDVANGLLYYITPFIDGASLREHLRRGDVIPIEAAIRIARDTASALDYAHRREIVHRDVKPGNIMITEGRAIVTDFGIARAVGEASDRTLTAAGSVIGTLAYASPEQLRGDRDIDGRSDIYSLGCVVYEMLAGRPPFAGATDSLMRQHLLEAPERPSVHRDGIPAHVEAAVMSALAKDPADRPKSAAAFAATLEDAGGGSGLPARRRVAMARVAATIGAGLIIGATLLVRGCGS